MPRIGHNLVANLVGKAWYAGLNFIFPPLYARLLGIESYGLIGLYTTLVAVFAILDLGLSTTLNREMARLSDDHAGTSRMGATVRTFEWIYWCLGILAGSLVIVLAPLIAQHWVKAQQMPISSVTTAIRLTGVVLALQWPGGLYIGGLIGLQRQVTANVVVAVFSTIRLGGAALMLVLTRRSVETFFVWQALAFGAQTVATRVALVRLVPSGAPARFSLSLLREHWRLSAGIFGIGILTMLLTNTDKVILSKLLSLRDLGYYTLAWTLGTALYTLIGPVYSAIFPRLTQLVQRGDEAATRRLYHLSSQVMAVLVLPAACTVALFPREVVLLWTGDPTMAREMHVVVALVTVGTALNGLMNVPYALQLAHAWTKLAAGMNFVALLFFVPLVYYLTARFGRDGAAAGWVALNAGYVAVGVHLQHRRLLRRDIWRWYGADTAVPLCAALLFALALRLVLAPAVGRFQALLWIAAASSAAYVAAGLAAGLVRTMSMRTIRRVLGNGT